MPAILAPPLTTAVRSLPFGAAHAVDVWHNDDVFIAVAALILITSLPLSSAARINPATGGAPPAAPHSDVMHAGKGRFLVASRTLGDPNFAETVVLLLAYEPGGAVGVIINRPSEVRVASVLPNVKELHERSDQIFVGGPVGLNEVLFVIRVHARPSSADAIFSNVYATGSLDVVRHAIASLSGDDRFRAYAGRAGWGPGQLDAEIARGDWIVIDADAELVFDAPATEIWPKLIERHSGQWTRAQTPAPLDVLATLPTGG